jgi:hypothetical protein
MGQFQAWAMICVRKVKNIYSHQAQLDGDFMRQKWRIYGLSNSSLLKALGFVASYQTIVIFYRTNDTLLNLHLAAATFTSR